MQLSMRRRFGSFAWTVTSSPDVTSQVEDIPSTGSEHAWEHTAQLQLSATETCLAVASPVFRAADAHHCKVWGHVGVR